MHAHKAEIWYRVWCARQAVADSTRLNYDLRRSGFEVYVLPENLQGGIGSRRLDRWWWR